MLEKYNLKLDKMSTIEHYNIEKNGRHLPVSMTLLGYNLSDSIVSEYSLKTPDNSDEQRVFYNRVPKCGSGAMMSMITELKKRNRFNVFRSSDYYNLSISAIAEQAFVSMYEDLRPPNVYDRHVYFIDFTKSV